jgi:regulator of replication initiation timing
MTSDGALAEAEEFVRDRTEAYGKEKALEAMGGSKGRHAFPLFDEVVRLREQLSHVTQQRDDLLEQLRSAVEQGQREAVEMAELRHRLSLHNGSYNPSTVQQLCEAVISGDESASELARAVLDSAPTEAELHEISQLVDREELNAAKPRVDALAARYGEHHPEVIRVRTMIEFLEHPVADDCDCGGMGGDR